MPMEQCMQPPLTLSSLPQVPEGKTCPAQSVCESDIFVPLFGLFVLLNLQHIQYISIPNLIEPLMHEFARASNAMERYQYSGGPEI